MRKRSSKKKEILLEPTQLANGKFNHYIRGWSSYTSIKSLTQISHDLVKACTKDNREVGPIPRTNILILPDDENKPHDNDAHEGGHVIVEVELADQLRIEGITKKIIREKAVLIQSWQSLEMGNEVDHKPYASANQDEDIVHLGDVPEEHSDTRPIELSSATVSPKRHSDLADLQKINVKFGADFDTLDNCITGDLHIMGVEPNIVVHQDIVFETVQDEKTALIKKSNGRRDKGKKHRKSKLTAEQLLELERQKSEEQTLREQQVQESIERARKREEYMKKFSHPDRWARVTISGVTFTGNVCVSRAHVTFQNCRFMTNFRETKVSDAQLSIFPYSVVHLVKCTFETSVCCGLYAFPSSQVWVKKCLFTGLSHQELEIAELRNQSSNKRICGKADKVEISSLKSSDESFSKVVVEPHKGANLNRQSLSEELMQRYTELFHNNTKLVGIHVDSARISVQGCRFTFLGIGVLFSGHCVVSELPSVPLVADEPKSSVYMSMTDSYLHYIYGIAVMIDACDVLLSGNEIHDCEYYGLNCLSQSKNVTVLRNSFGVHALVRIQKSAKIKFLNNLLHEALRDDNVYDNPCLETTY